MTKTGIFVTFIIMSAFLAGCANTPAKKYNWGNYEDSLYDYYKDPTKTAALEEALKDAIDDAEDDKAPVAPGLYAEYGFLLLQEGKSAEAVSYFQKEKQQWPESTQFMDTMIQTASQNK